MSSGGHYSGGRTRMGTKIYLNLYDLSPANDYLFPIGFGLHHSGVEVSGSEYSFASGAGVFEQATPREAPGALYRETLELGVFDGGQKEFKVALAEVRHDFGPDDYNLIRKNCNHFANALVWKLLGRQIPAHINRLADMGVCCSCLLPKKMMEQAPVGDPNATSSSSSGFQTFGGGQRNRQSATPTFSGSGARLGGSSTTSTHSTSGEENGGLTSRLMGSHRSLSPRTEDLTDRRDKARKAAIARLERQKEDTQTKTTN